MLDKNIFFCSLCQKEINDDRELEYINNEYFNNNIRSQILIDDIWSILDQYNSKSYECETCLTIEKIKCEFNSSTIKNIEYDSKYDIYGVLINFFSQYENKNIYLILKSSKLTEISWFYILRKVGFIKELVNKTDKKNIEECCEQRTNNRIFYTINNNSLKSKRELMNDKKKKFNLCRKN